MTPYVRRTSGRVRVCASLDTPLVSQSLDAHRLEISNSFDSHLIDTQSATTMVISIISTMDDGHSLKEEEDGVVPRPSGPAEAERITKEVHKMVVLMLEVLHGVFGYEQAEWAEAEDDHTLDGNSVSTTFIPPEWRDAVSEEANRLYNLGAFTLADEDSNGQQGDGDVDSLPQRDGVGWEGATVESRSNGV
eukprot:425198-Ditylum_brightwellii.AAC.2